MPEPKAALIRACRSRRAGSRKSLSGGMPESFSAGTGISPRILIGAAGRKASEFSAGTGISPHFHPDAVCLAKKLYGIHTEENRLPALDRIGMCFAGLLESGNYKIVKSHQFVMGLLQTEYCFLPRLCLIILFRRLTNRQEHGGIICQD